jgi:hypothetical protein
VRSAAGGEMSLHRKSISKATGDTDLSHSRRVWFFGKPPT